MYACRRRHRPRLRAAWFLLTASHVLRATLLQAGSPAEPLFAPATLRKSVSTARWDSLRDLVMSVGRTYFPGSTLQMAPATGRREPHVSPRVAAPRLAGPFPGLEETLQEFGHLYPRPHFLASAAERAAPSPPIPGCPCCAAGRNRNGARTVRQAGCIA